MKQTIDVSQHHSFQHILQRYAWEKCRAFLSLLTLLLVLILTPYAQLEAAQTGQLTVNLTDRLSQQKLSGLSVTAYQRASDGKLKWFANKTTDTQGQAIFTLEGLGFGQNYVLTVNAFNNITTYSKVVSSSGIFAFQVGALSASITSGADGSLLKNYSITAYEILADGKQKWRTSGKTDQQGIIRFDLENLGSGTNYILKAKSPVDSSYKNSQIISNIGKIAFKVGNKALNITLRDSISGQIIAGQKVIVQELLANDKSDWITERTTDANGQIIVDLDGLGAGRSYKLASKIYNNLYSYSDLITTTGSFTFNVGTLAVAVKSGASEKALPDFRITVYERLSDASNKWHASGNTDTSGIIRFDLPGLSNGREYFLRATSLIDGSTKYSPDLTLGAVTFTVGNKPLNVTLVNALTNQPLANQRIDVKEILPNDEYKWRQRLTTDAQGKVAFDLDGLGSGRLYQLKSSPYQAGSVYSEILNTTGNFSFAVGNTPVTLIDARNGKAMAGFKLTSIEKTPDGKLHWKNSGTTDAQGVVNFDLSGVNSGRLYTILAKNAFAQNKYYFSPWISESGKVVFSISPSQTYRPDQKVPVISISSPSANALVSSKGFLLRGLVSDNDAIDRVEVNIGGSSGLATVSNNYWEYSVSAAMLGGLGNIPLTVTAYDVAQNETQVGLSVNSIVDDEFPALDISSHLNGDKVSVKGFLISGNVSDNTGVRRLSADVNDSIYGKVKSDSKIEISASGRWTLVVEEVTLGATIDIVIKAVDSAGNLSSETVNLQVVSVIDDGVQLINRLTFGATPDLLDEVRKMGAQAFINQQLNPSTIDDTAFQDRIAFEVPDSHRDLIDYQLKYAIYSKRQLLEVMTWFWENHFNTDVNKTRHVGYELGENNLFRRHALGNFRDLLAVSSKSPGMMVYLDNITNRKEEPNENYARELMELHTLGVNGGYTNEDVAEVARVFTGWQERDHAFYFNDSRHDYGEKLFVGNVIPAGLGVEGGEMILDILASHPATAKFICTKLLQVFVDDKPLPGSISGCSASFLSSNGNIKQVLQTIFASSEFNSPRQFHQKFKTPIEFLAGAERNLMAQHSPRNTYAEIQNLGMPLFHNPVPTGWAETGAKWINMNQLMTRIRFGTNLAFNEENYYNSNTYLNSVTEFFRSRGYETAQGVLGYLLMLTVDGDYTPFEWSVAYNKLTQDGRVPFELDAEESEQALRAMIATVLSFPAYQLQ